MTYLMSIVAAVIVWDLIYQYYIHNRLDQLIKDIKSIRDDVDTTENELRDDIRVLQDKTSDVYYITHLMNEDLKDVRKSEQRRQLHEEYKTLADRYKKLAKEYES